MTQNENQNFQNFKRRAFELCLAIYRLTKLFPPGEIITKQLRESASETVVFLATGRIHDTILKTEAIQVFLAIAKAQNWLKPINFDLLKMAYFMLSEKLKENEREQSMEFKKGDFGKKINNTPLLPRLARPELSSALPKIKKQLPDQTILSELDQRHRMIIDYLNKNQHARVSDLVNLIGNVGERTIRYDLSDLINKNLIKKIGDRKSAKYLLA